MPDYSLLDSLELPQGIKQLSGNQLNRFAAELREFMINSVSKTGGHLSSSLGVVELTVALHYVFDSPQDHIVWDVGHQSYPHKIMTGRKKDMAGLRKLGGISGFPKLTESTHDAFGTGHSSTSISAALGIALAKKNHSNGSHSIAVIGDGALTGGMAFEALNHAGVLDANLLVVLNDNEMSISENVGALSLYLGRVLSSRPYSKIRGISRAILNKIPVLCRFAQKAEEHLKGMIVPGTLFEEFGFNYIGPLDGHDMDIMIRALSIMKNQQGPQLLHVLTKKGKGYAPAECDPVSYHGVGKTTSNSVRKKTRTYTEVFSGWLEQAALKDDKIVAITPAMTEGSGLSEFADKHPARFYDVGIAEQHALTMAAGLATAGIKPVVAIYSTFLQRAYDQLIHDVALQNLPVIFAIDRAGIVGEDGPTHAGVFDLSFLRCVPNLEILAPMSGDELKLMLDYALTVASPVAVRYPRGIIFDYSSAALFKGKAQVLREGKKTVIFAFGSMVQTAMAVADRLNASLINMRFIKPLDEAIIIKYAVSHEVLVSIEENAIKGGAGSAVAEVLHARGMNKPLSILGINDEFTAHGDKAQLLKRYGLDEDGIMIAVEKSIARISENK